MGVARPLVDERIKMRGESVHGNVNAYATRAAPERGGYVVRPIPAYGSGAAFRRTLLFRLQPCVEPVLLAQSPSIAARIGMVDAIADDRGDQQRHQQHQAVCNDQSRSEERRVGKERVSQCRSRWARAR